MNKKKSVKEDWRYQNQDNYLGGLKFEFVEYQPNSGNDHDHCEFCGKKFSILIEKALKKGGTDESRQRWICKKCFEDFKKELKLQRK